MALTAVVDPNDLRFTQDTISPAFKPPYQGVFLKDVIAQIKRKGTTAFTFPKPEVIKHENTLWCLDNRRLYVFRKAKVDRIDVLISTSRTHPRLSAVLEDPGKKKKMMKKGYFPFVLPYEPGKRVHTDLPPLGFPPLPPRHKYECSSRSRTSAHHPGPNSNTVVGQPGQYQPWSSPMQYPRDIIWLYSTEVHHLVQIGPARNLEVAVCAPPPPPIVISPRPWSTSKCSPRQVPSGPIVCAYKKEERLALPMMRRFMKPNACRDPKPVCSEQDLKGKVAAVMEQESSRLPSKNLSGAGPTMSSNCPASASWWVYNLEISVRNVNPDSVSPGMGNPKDPPAQPKEAPSVLDASKPKEAPIVLDLLAVILGLLFHYFIYKYFF